jgi:hypothetical protein
MARQGRGASHSQLQTRSEEARCTARWFVPLPPQPQCCSFRGSFQGTKHRSHNQDNSTHHQHCRWCHRSLHRPLGCSRIPLGSKGCNWGCSKIPCYHIRRYHTVPQLRSVNCDKQASNRTFASRSARNHRRFCKYPLLKTPVLLRLRHSNNPILTSLAVFGMERLYRGE